MLSILGCIEISTESLCDSGVTTDVVIVFPSFMAANLRFIEVQMQGEILGRGGIRASNYANNGTLKEQ